MLFRKSMYSLEVLFKILIFDWGLKDVNEKLVRWRKRKSILCMENSKCEFFEILKNNFIRW